MPRVVITGGPGAGKTTLLAELAAMGYATVPESARAIIAERLAAGLPPRPAPLEFAREILRRDIAKHAAHPESTAWVFFDRGAVEGLGMVHEASPIPRAELASRLSRLAFHRTVFVLPPWKAIYRNDSERDHPFAHAEGVHEALSHWYRSCGYELDEVPRLSPRERAGHVLGALERGGPPHHGRYPGRSPI